ncbi:THO complex subunit 5, partial [Phenoliferia sp. Uapishka_3]
MATLPHSISTSLKALSEQLVQSRLQSSDPSSFDPTHFLSESAPLFAILSNLNRESNVFTKESKDRTSMARVKMDGASLRLQNLKFEQNHLEREIRKCEEFESSYLSLPLLPVPDFIALASSPSPPPSIPQPLPTDPHELLLARLAHELEERKRLDVEKKELGVEKGMLVKENEVKKGRLDELERQLEEFVKSAKLIATKMEDE